MTDINPATGRAWGPIDHGSPRGYRAHRRRHEEPCDACRDAWSKDGRRRRRAGGLSTPKARKRRPPKPIEPPQINGATPTGLVLYIAHLIDEWAADCTTSPQVSVQEPAIAVAGSLTRLRVSVTQLEKALLAEQYKANRRAS